MKRKRLMNHVSFNFSSTKFDDDEKKGKMKCHKLEVYGLLNSDEIPYFYTYTCLDRRIINILLFYLF